MRRAIRSLGFVLGALAIGVTLGVFSERVAPIDPLIRARAAYAATHASSARWVSYGSSHSRALDFAALGVDGVPLWFPSSDLDDTLLSATRSLPALDSVTCALVAFPYTSLVNDPAKRLGSRDRENRLFHLTARLEPVPLRWSELEPALLAYLQPLVRHDHWLAVFKELANPSEATPPPALTAAGTVAYDEAAPLPAEVRARSRSAAARHLERTTNAPDVVAANRRWLENLLRLAVDRDLDLVLYTPPYPSAYRDALPADVVNAARRTAAELSAANPHVAYLDHGADPRFTETAGHFYDHHMSPAGAAAFSALLRDELNELPATPAGCRPGEREAGG